MPTPISIRCETPANLPAIRRVNEAAFGRAVEADLVDALRDAGAAVLSLVAEADDEVVGHLLFSPLLIETEGNTREAVALAPLAVLPERQRQGIGTRLVEDGLARLRDDGHAAVIVIGHAAYYPRFGFRRASGWGLRFEIEGPDEAFMALELVPGTLAGGGTVRYRPEFASCDDRRGDA